VLVGHGIHRETRQLQHSKNVLRQSWFLGAVGFSDALAVMPSLVPTLAGSLLAPGLLTSREGVMRIVPGYLPDVLETSCVCVCVCVCVFMCICVCECM
jgi:hypothetical protein